MTYGNTKTGKLWRRWKKVVAAAAVLLMMSSFVVTAAYSSSWQVVSVAAQSSYAAGEGENQAESAPDKRFDVEVGEMTAEDEILTFTITCRYDGEAFPCLEDISGVAMQYTGIVSDGTQNTFRFDSETAGTDWSLSEQDHQVEAVYRCSVYAPEITSLAGEDTDCHLAVVLLYYDEQNECEGRAEYQFVKSCS